MHLFGLFLTTLLILLKMVEPSINYYWENSSEEYDTPTIDSYVKNMGGNVSGQFPTGKLGAFFLFGLITLGTNAAEPRITYSPIEIGIETLISDNDDVLLQESKQICQSWKEETANLALLKDNWDGEGAMKMSTTSISNVLFILDNKNEVNPKSWTGSFII